MGLALALSRGNNSNFFYLIGVLLLISGCATVKYGTVPPGLDNPRTIGEVLEQDAGNENSEKKAPIVVMNNGELSVRGVKLKNSKFDFPIVVNSRVEYWIDYFTGRGRGHFSRYLERSEFFIPYIRPILKQNSVPEDLVYLAMIESGFNNHARSHARAVGSWQFISATGKRYGLMVNWWVDERRDIRKSTLAAVEYLKDLYNMFQSWELAAASYNAGESKVARAVRRFGTKDFWVIARHRFLRPETRDYVPKIIAAAIIAKNREQFGFPAPQKASHEGEAVAGDGEIVRLIKTDKPEDKLDDPNSEAPNSEADDESLDTYEALAEADEDRNAGGDAAESSGPEITPASLTVAGESMPLAKPVPTPHVSKTGEVGGEELSEFEVQSPADLLKVARAAGLSYQTVKSLNPELLRWCTPPNVGSYRIKLPVSVKDKFLTTYNHDAYPRKVQFMTYKVRRGETLSRIAGHFGIKVDPISDLNGVSTKMPLRNGLHVLLPMPTDRSRSLASLEIRDPPERRRFRKRVRHNRRYQRISYKQRRESAAGTRSSRRPAGAT